MTQITTNITREELIKSREYTYNDTSVAKKGTKINNVPTATNGISAEAIEKNLVNLATRVLQPLRDAACKKYGKEIYIRISSAYRCLIYNADVGGTVASEHLYGLAADITMYYIDDKGNRVFLTNKEIIDLCAEYKIPYERIIDEQLYSSTSNAKNNTVVSWIHISTPFGNSTPKLIHREARNSKTDLTTKYTTVKQGKW